MSKVDHMISAMIIKGCLTFNVVVNHRLLDVDVGVSYQGHFLQPV